MSRADFHENKLDQFLTKVGAWASRKTGQKITVGGFGCDSLRRGGDEPTTKSPFGASTLNPSLRDQFTQPTNQCKQEYDFDLAEAFHSKSKSRSRSRSRSRSKKGKGEKQSSSDSSSIYSESEGSADSSSSSLTSSSDVEGLELAENDSRLHPDVDIIMHGGRGKLYSEQPDTSSDPDDYLA